MTFSSQMRRAVEAALDETDGSVIGSDANRRRHTFTEALAARGFCIISTADALAAARLANNAVVLGVSDADPDLGRRLEPGT